MTLIEVALLGVRNFQQITRFEFSPGLNFIIGGNASGKTTLRDALLYSLFAHHPEQEQTLIDRGTPSTCQCAITFKTRSGETYRLAKDFIKDIRVLSKYDPAIQKFVQIEKRKENVLRWLQQLCGGLDGPKISYYFSIDRSRLPSNLIPRTQDKPATSIPAPDRQTDRVRGEDAGIPDHPEDPSAKLTRLHELKVIADKAEQVYQWEEQLSDAQIRARTLKRKLARLEDLDRELGQIKERTGAFTGLEDRLEQVEQLVQEFEEKLAERNREHRTLEEDRTLLEHQINLVPTDPIYKQKTFLVGVLATGLSIGTPLFVSLPGITQHLYLVGLLIGLGLMITSIILDARWLSRKKILEDKVSGKLKNLELLEARFKRENAKFFDLLKKTNTDSLEAFKEKMNACNLLSATRQLLLEERNRISEGRDIQALQEEYEEQSRLIQEFEEKMRNCQDLPPDLPTLNEEISILEKEVAAQWPGRLQPAAVVSSDPVARKAGPFHAGNGSLDSIKALLHDPLIQDRNQAFATAREVFSKLSLGAGRDLIVDESGSPAATVSLGSKDPSSRVPLHALSSGTLDQVFFSLYLGLLTNLGPDYPFPVILDDPLLSLDYQRQKIILEILREVSHQRQLIIMSHLPYPAREGEQQIKL